MGAVAEPENGSHQHYIYDRKHVKLYVEMTVNIRAAAAPENRGHHQTYIHNLIRYKTHLIDRTTSKL